MDFRGRFSRFFRGMSSTLEQTRLLEEQEKAYKAKISALEKRIKALEEEVKKLKVRMVGFEGPVFVGNDDFWMGKTGVNGGDCCLLFDDG